MAGATPRFATAPVSRTLVRYAADALSRVALFLAVSGSVASCVYLQNDSQLKTATDASQKFSAFEKSTPTPFQAMLDNQQKLESVLQEDFERQSDLHAQAVVLSLPDKTWQQLRTELLSNDAERKTLTSDLQSRLNLALEAASITPEEITTAGDQQKAIDNSISTTVAKQNELEANRVLFQESIKTIANASSSKDPTTSLKQNAPDILNAPVTTITYANGQFGQKSSTVEAELPAIKGQLQNGDLSYVRDVTVGQFDPKSQPGLSLVILSVAADATRSESQRLNVRLQYLRALQNVISAGLADAAICQTTTNTLVQLQQVLKVAPQRDTVLDTLNALSPQASQNTPKGKVASEGIYNASHVVSDYALDETIVLDRLELLEENVVSLQHSYSIQVSAANAQERQQLIELGIQGLVTYQQNGITSDEIANLIRAAQTVALSFVAAGVF
ncbi:MAG: hypothetical protein ACLQAT_17120 [Candidatus Binataceae bacterium]